MSALGFDNPILWAQFRLKGGWRSFFFIGGGYLGLCVLAIAWNYIFAPTPRLFREWMEGLTIMLMISQSVTLLLVGSSRVGAAVRLDMSSRLIESHRLMPADPSWAVVGYVLGATARVWLVAAINLFVGMLTGMMGGVSMHSWLMYNAVIAGFSTTMWCALVLLAFMGAKSFWISTVFLGVGFVSRGVLLMFVPAMMLLVTPLQGRTAFAFGRGAAADPESFIISQAFGWCFALLFIRASARKYARQNSLAFTVPAAMVMLYLWIGASVVGMLLINRIQMLDIYRGEENFSPMFVGAIATTILMALLPMASAAWTAILRERAKPAKTWVGRNSRFIVCWLLTLAAIFVMMGVPFHLTYSTSQMVTTMVRGKANYNYQTTENHIVTAMISDRATRVCVVGAIGITLAQAYVLMRGLYPRSTKANWAVALIGGIFWFAPMAADLARLMIYDFNSNDSWLCFGLASSLGDVIAACSEQVHRKWMVGGLIFQFLVLVWVWLTFKLLAIRNRRARERAQAATLAMALPTAVV